MTERTTMNDFAANYLYVKDWCRMKKVTMTEMRLTSKVDKDDPNSNTCVLDGVEFRLWKGGRPVNRKTLQMNCCADAAYDGTPISANQAKVNLVKWLSETTDAFYRSHSNVKDDLIDWGAGKP